MFFIDESGHPHPSDRALRPVLLATSLPVREMRNLTRRVYRLKKDLFGDTNPWLETKYKAAAILNERTFRKIREKWEYIEQMFEIAANTSGMQVAAVVMERPTRVLDWPENRLPAQWYYVLSQLQPMIQADGADAYGVLVLDSQDAKSDTRLSVQIGNYLYRSSAGQQLTQLVETPLFVSSHITPGIQLADLFAGCVRLYHEINEEGRTAEPAFHRSVDRLYAVIRRLIPDRQFADEVQRGVFYLSAARLEELCARASVVDRHADETTEQEAVVPGSISPEIGIKD
ncbi:MAG: DUF3800 domain-containing protein [Armatimonadetes bacterium]|nr:DUF3800 domain-containing protein [Armatimonadota bacterium]